jgi:hypothetical protein
MPPITFPRVTLLAIVLAAAAFVRADPDADGFVSLFNGKDLSGWVPVNVAPDTFSVKDGLIVCTGVPTGVMRSEKMYENFIVELEWRHLRPGGNSGFFVWADAITSKGVPFTRAIENQILDGKGGDGFTTQGDVFPIHGATMTPGNPGKWKGRSYPIEERTKPSPEWNHYRIECNNGAISLAVNGKIVTTGKDVSVRKGYLCLESEGGLIHFRNIRIKELPPMPDLDPKFIARADEGFKSLYTGLDLSGWTTGEQGKSAWQARDWTLHFELPKEIQPGAANAYVLRSEQKVKNFELIVDYRQWGGEPPQIIVRDVPIQLPALPQDKPAWHRAHITLKGSALGVNVDDLPIPLNVKFPADVSEAAIGLNPSGTTDFANIYLKPLQ